MIPRTSDYPVPPVPHYGGRLNEYVTYPAPWFRATPTPLGEDEDILPGQYPESPYSIKDLSGFSDWVGGVWDILTGKPQSWYTHLDQDQQALAVRSAEINAIGEGPWNMVRDAYLANTQGPDVDFLSFSDINNGITQNLKTLLVTKDHVPSDQEIAAVEAYNAQYGRYVDYVKSMVPEVAAQVKADSDAVRAALGPGTMKSPSSVGKQAFVDEVERRAGLLGGAVGGAVALYFLIPAVVLAVMSGGRK